MKYKLLLFFSLVSTIFYAQGNFEYDYMGTLVVSDTVLLTYEIEFNIIDKNIKGFSYTDINGPDETKSRISGSYNAKTGALDFKESEILYTKSLFNETDFCFVNGVGKLKFQKKDSSIGGSFTGNMPNGDTCAVGDFNLMSLKSIRKKLEKLNKKVNKSIFIKKKTKKEFNKANIMDEIKVSILRADDNLSVFCDSSTVKIELWDNQIEDGDVITVIFNGKPILSNYKILNKKRVLQLDLVNKKNTLEFIANKTGLSGPCSGTVNLIDKNKITNITTSLELNKKATIVLIK